MRGQSRPGNAKRLSWRHIQLNVDSRFAIPDSAHKAVVPGHVQRRVFGIGEGVHPFEGFLRHDGEFAGRVSPFKREGYRAAGLGGRQDGLAVHDVRGPLLGHECVQGADEGLAFGQLEFERPDQHPDFEAWTCRHAIARTFRIGAFLDCEGSGPQPQGSSMPPFQLQRSYRMLRDGSGMISASSLFSEIAVCRLRCLGCDACCMRNLLILRLL